MFGLGTVLLDTPLEAFCTLLLNFHHAHSSWGCLHTARRASFCTLLLRHLTNCSSSSCTLCIRLVKLLKLPLVHFSGASCTLLLGSVHLIWRGGGELMENRVPTKHWACQLENPQNNKHIKGGTHKKMVLHGEACKKSVTDIILKEGSPTKYDASL